MSIRTTDGRLLEFVITYSAAIPAAQLARLRHAAARCSSRRRESKTAKLKYFDPKKAPARELEGPVPQGRKYRIAEELPWVEEERAIEPKTPYADWYDNLYAAIREGAAPNVTMESVRQTIEVMDKVRASSQWKY